MISPTIGRKVWYRPSEYDKSGPGGMQAVASQPCDATVVYVHGDRLVNLLVVDHNGNTHKRTSVHLVQEGDETPSGCYAEWMPYQVGQAKKAEAAA